MADLTASMAAAAEAGDIKKMESLLAEGADIHGHHDRYTPLINAVDKKQYGAVVFLLSKGAGVNMPALESGWTPLIFAAHHGHREIAQLLLENGANKHAKNKDGETAADMARKNSHGAIARLIEEASLPPKTDEVVFTRAVHDRLLQEIFDFANGERLTFIRRGNDNAVEAVQRDSFKDLTDTSGLRRAFEEHKKRGGKRTEEEVFPNDLRKTRVLPQPKP